MYSNLCTNEITFTDKKAVYTSGDILTGNILINVKEPFQVKSVGLEIECIAEAAVTEGFGDTYVNYHQSYKAFDDEQRLFPFHDSGSEETLDKNVHSYPFAFTLPSAESLPPTMYLEDDFCTVKWYVKANIVHKDGNRIYTPRKKIFFVPKLPEYAVKKHPLTVHHEELLKTNVFTKDAVSSLNHQVVSLFSHKYRTDVEVTAHLDTPTHGIKQWPYTSGIELSFVANHDNLVRVKKLRLRLQASTYGIVNGHYQAFMDRHYDILKLKPNVILNSEPQLLSTILGAENRGEGLTLPMLLDPSLQLPVLRRKYRLSVRVELESLQRQGHSKAYIFQMPVVVAAIDGEVFSLSEPLPQWTQPRSVNPRHIPFPFARSYAIDAWHEPKSTHETEHLTPVQTHGALSPVITPTHTPGITPNVRTPLGTPTEERTGYFDSLVGKVKPDELAKTSDVKVRHIKEGQVVKTDELPKGEPIKDLKKD